MATMKDIIQSPLLALFGSMAPFHGVDHRADLLSVP